MSEEFAGTQRFHVNRQVGSGGMGVVYEVQDSAWDCRVALKTIRQVDAAMLLLLKQEFRALADLTHPNVIQLYELIGDVERCFFTMEFVDGSGFLEHVWRNRVDSSDLATVPMETLVSKTLVANAPQDMVIAAQPARAKIRCPADPERLRDSLRQLTNGVLAIHEHAMLHRDIKPRNIMVDRNGRVVLLDFGIAGMLPRAGVSYSPQRVAGTLAYMAPEQAIGSSLTFAADWYAVGATIYEALTGTTPYAGNTSEVQIQKKSFPPVPPSYLTTEVPRDLEELCLALLDPLPDRRPNGEEVARVLGGTSTAGSALPSSLINHDHDHLIGRDAHRDTLENAFQTARQGRMSSIFVRGESGCGKSALINEFLDGLGRDGESVVLRGRCYEQESVPYKGFDELLDSLVEMIEHWTPERLRNILPPQRAELLQVFPVLRRLDPQTRPIAPNTDPVETRTAARAGFRELLFALATRTPLVLFIDDLQWGDVETAGLLAELFHPPNDARILIVCAFKDQQSRCLETIAHLPFHAGLYRRDLDVGPLALHDARQLARMLLPENQKDGEWAEWLANESGGNPFFLRVLATFSMRERASLKRSNETQERRSDGSFTMEAVIWQWLNTMSPDAIGVLEAMAVCGRPMMNADVLKAASLEPGPSLVARLRGARMVRSTGLGPSDRVELYHDRIRQTILSRLRDSVAIEYHRRLAETFALHADPDAEQMAVHWRSAGKLEESGRWYILAADRAAAALAFDRACSLYRAALELAPLDTTERLRVERGLADSLANAGRGAEAARHYLAIHANAPEAERTLLLEQAAQHFCASGYVDEGISAYKELLVRVGTRYPTSMRVVIAGILFNDLKLRARGLRFRERQPEQISALEAARVDALWSAGFGLSVIDIGASAYFIKYCLVAALRLGDPARIARALSWAATHDSAVGPKMKKRALFLLENCRDLAEQNKDARSLSWYHLAGGALWLQLGNWRRSYESLQTAESMLRGFGRDVQREITFVQMFQLLTLIGLGRFADLERLGPVHFDAAMERGNLFVATNLASWVLPQVKLARDDPEGARRDADMSVEQWSHQGYHLQHLWAMLSKANALVYEGEALKAIEYLDSQWPAAAGSLLFRAHLPRAFAYHVRARALMMAAEQSSKRDAFLREALQQTRQLERENAVWSSAAAVLLRSAASHLLGDHVKAISLLREAERLFVRADMGAYVASVRSQLANFLSGAEAERYRLQADEWMHAEGIRNPDRFAALHAPGFGASGG